MRSEKCLFGACVLGDKAEEGLWSCCKGPQIQTKDFHSMDSLESWVILRQEGGRSVFKRLSLGEGG